MLSGGPHDQVIIAVFVVELGSEPLRGFVRIIVIVPVVVINLRQGRFILAMVVYAVMDYSYAACVALID